jgi:hypothetical protein
MIEIGMAEASWDSGLGEFVPGILWLADARLLGGRVKPGHDELVLGLEFCS